MKLRYYMRGLGIGVIVTAVIMGISLGGTKEKLSDDEIRIRAKELGMVESVVLSSIGTDQKEDPTDTEGSVQDEAPEPSVTATAEDDTVDTDGEPGTGSGPDSSEADADQSEAGTDVFPDQELLTITINRGESSVSVSRSLEEAGLVEDAKEYDKYLCSNGYDKSLAVGTYQIPVGSSEETIAKVLTKKLSFE